MTKPSERGSATPVILAILIMVAIAAAVYFLVPHKITDVSVSGVDLFAPHTQFGATQSDESMHVLGQAAQTEDDLYVVAHLNLTDKLRSRIFLAGWSATVTFADGTTADSTLVARSELPRLEQVFPQITPLVTQPLGDGDELDPGTTKSGSIVLLFPNVTEAKWKSKKSAVLTIDLHEHVSQTVNLP